MPPKEPSLVDKIALRAIMKFITEADVYADNYDVSLVYKMNEQTIKTQERDLIRKSPRVI